jgi:hypothetical protein
MLNELTAPAHVMVTPVTVVAAVPVLVRVRSSAAPATLHVGAAAALLDRRSAATRFCPVTWTCAELDAEPKMPKTKPPIATAAMRVTAMISTVAMIGEMALRIPYILFRTFIKVDRLGLIFEP